MSTIYSDGIRVEFAGTVLRQRDDGLYWLTAEHQTIGYGSTIGLYLCRKTAKRDTYEWDAIQRYAARKNRSSQAPSSLT